MINIRFINSGKTITGFELSGHSGYAEQGSDIVCAAVSSAAYMAVNTVTDILNLNADISVDDGFLRMKLTSQDALKAQDVLRGFELHITELSKQYQSNIKVDFSEV